MAKKKQINRKVSRNTGVTRGSGNVFADLALRDAAELQVKAGLTLQIHNRIKALGLSQIEAGKLLGISQPDVSKLMRGRYTGFSADRLIALLSVLRVDVDIVIRPHSRNERHGKGRVNLFEEDPREGKAV